MKIAIDDYPVPWGCNEKKDAQNKDKVGRTDVWRDIIAKKVEQYVTRLPKDKVAHVHLEFRFDGKHLYSSDLDNLAKPVLDTLFKSKHQQTDDKISGRLFDFDDKYITSLSLSKKEVKVHEKPGVDISIYFK